MSSLYVFGSNYNNTLCFGNKLKNRKVIIEPTLFEGFELDQNENNHFNNEFIKASLGHRHTLLLDNCGRVFGFGTAMDGQLGKVNKSKRIVEKPIEILGDLHNKRVIDIKASNSNSAAITSDFELYQWGLLVVDLNKENLEQSHIKMTGLADDGTHSRMSDKLKKLLKKSTAAYLTQGGDGLGGYNNKDEKNKIDDNNLNNMSISNQNIDDEGVLAVKTTRMNIPSPRKALLPKGCKVYKISLGYAHAVIITNYGLFSSGYNDRGQLGHGHRINSAEFKPVLGELNCIDISCGNSHNLAIDENNNLYTWGSNSLGQLGLGKYI